jgi:hypothetical protein
MRFARSLAKQSPSIVISTLALMFSLGGGAYAATQLTGQHPTADRAKAPPACTSVKFHALKLANGWKSAQSLYDSGNPSYGICNGIVYLAGSLVQPKPGSDIVGTLPRGYRPAHNLWIAVYTFQDSVGTIFIDNNGQMRAFSPTTSDAESYTSLAAVSFPLGS